LTNLISAKDVAVFLGKDLVGKDMSLTSPAALGAAGKGSLCFISKPIYNEPKSGSLFLIQTHKIPKHSDVNSYVVINDPKLAFSKVVNRFFERKVKPYIADSSIVRNGAKIGAGCTIEDNVVIGPEVSVGDCTHIGAGTVIKGPVEIGSHCYIASNVTIGEPGLGSLQEEDGSHFMMPHIGSVYIGSNVTIGPGSTVQRSTLEATVVSDGVKISQMVSVGHNVRIEKNVVVAAMAHFSGSCCIGRDSFIGANCTLRDYVTVGENCKIGHGAVISSDISDNAIVQAVPADILEILR
jgi:UDP-3-O-[3-hydroxymyristoyl] glucosamine N-acyltransferase